MNGKLSKALRDKYRHMDRATLRSLRRHISREGTLQAQQPKPVVERRHKERERQPMSSSAWKRTGPLVFQRVTKHMTRDMRKMFGVEDGKIPMNSLAGKLPKHSLDRLVTEGFNAAINAVMSMHRQRAY